FKKHPRLYRQKIRALPPWNYYAIVAALAAMLWGIFGESLPLAVVAGAVWFGLTAQFCLKRLRHTAHNPLHVLEMIATSMLIPPVATFWRLVGALRWRVLFI